MLTYELSCDPSAEVVQEIDQGLHQYNVAHLGEDVINRYTRVAVAARDEAGQLIGGIYGDLFWEWLHIETLWVSESARGEGIGSELLMRLEQEAVAGGAGGAHLETTSFQALGFYQRHGYEIFGELEGKPSGVTWYYLKKQLGG